MSFHVGNPRHDGPQRRPPPDYLSRRVQLRLFTLVAMFVGVLWLMEQARKPHHWYWLWGGRVGEAGGSPLTESERWDGSREIDTRLVQSPRASNPPGVFVAQGEAADVHAAEEAVFDASEQISDEARLQRTRQDAWAHVIAHLSSADDERLRKALKASRDRQPPDEDTRQHWPVLIERLETSWDQYLADAFQYLLDSRDRLGDAQRAAWQSTVQRLEIEWRQATAPALKAVAGEEEPTAAHRESLAAIQDALDQIGLAAVRDNSVFRTAESHAWFRLVEQLDRTPLSELERATAGRVGFVQLFDQPREYRGKLVTVRGRASMGYRVRAPQNLAGIDCYYVFWLQPAGGPNSPLCVYALELPPGFPALKDKDRDRETTALDVEVEFTGYFFKRWAYRAQDGLRVAPLLLAKSPKWTPPPPSLGAGEPFGPVSTVMYVLGAAAAAAAISLLAYWQGRWRSAKKRGYQTLADRYAQRLRSLERNDPAVDVRETLRRLGDEPKA